MATRGLCRSWPERGVVRPACVDRVGDGQVPKRTPGLLPTAGRARGGGRGGGWGSGRGGGWPARCTVSLVFFVPSSPRWWPGQESPIRSRAATGDRVRPPLPPGDKPEPPPARPAFPSGPRSPGCGFESDVSRVLQTPSWPPEPRRPVCVPVALAPPCAPVHSRHPGAGPRGTRAENRPTFKRRYHERCEARAASPPPRARGEGCP